MTMAALGFLHQAGVLGMNQRNAGYIMQMNPRSSFPLVDDKLLTKHLAAQEDIPTPPVYHVVEHHAAIRGLIPALGDRDAFVVKPARGAGGSGIVLVTGRIGDRFVKPSGQEISPDELRYHVSSILSGIYSLEGLEDKAFVEALIHPDPVFSEVSYQGVPDIRIVTYRGIPVMAMLRLPTRASDGKANLHRGAVGCGVDIGTGITGTSVHQSLVITHHPDTGVLIRGIQVPCWGEMLVIAAKATAMTGLGYLGVDLVIDRERGPLLLELNARPGLQIQVANRAGLRTRLDWWTRPFRRCPRALPNALPGRNRPSGRGEVSGHPADCLRKARFEEPPWVP